MTLLLMAFAVAAFVYPSTQPHISASAPRALPISAMASPPPPQTRTSRLLIIGDSAALLTYNLGVSSLRAFAAGFDLANAKMQLTVQFVAIEANSAVAITTAWLIGASVTAMMDESWLQQQQAAGEGGRSPVSIARSMLPAFSVAVPLAFVAKALGVVAVIVPVGGWLALDAPTAVADLGGMMAATTLWRTVLLQTLP